MDISDIINCKNVQIRKISSSRPNPHYENNLDRNIDPRERPKFSRHYEKKPEGIKMNFFYSIEKFNSEKFYF